MVQHEVMPKITKEEVKKEYEKHVKKNMGRDSLYKTLELFTEWYVTYKEREWHLNQIRNTCPVCESKEREDMIINAGSSECPHTYFYIRCKNCGVWRS